MNISSIALLVNENAIDDLTIFIYTLERWNVSLPTLYIYCTSVSKDQISALQYKGTTYYNTSLDLYSNLTRARMERMPSNQNLSNKWHDFMNEKCNLMEWALTNSHTGVLLCDADLCWLGPLPVIPEGTEVALSPHLILESDEEKFGKYNGGLIWMSSIQAVQIWREASMVSKFFEQYALNTVAESYPIYEFGSHINYGWWRMFQGRVTPDKSKARWTIHRDDTHSGLCVDGEPVVCIHTHWKTTDYVTNMFNTWIVGKLTILKKNKKVAMILRFLGKL
jgi:hypothetical protein